MGSKKFRVHTTDGDAVGGNSNRNGTVTASLELEGPGPEGPVNAQGQASLMEKLLLLKKIQTVTNNSHW